jgi:hypothetical protein
MSFKERVSQTKDAHTFGFVSNEIGGLRGAVALREELAVGLGRLDGGLVFGEPEGGAGVRGDQRQQQNARHRHLARVSNTETKEVFFLQGNKGNPSSRTLVPLIARRRGRPHVLGDFASVRALRTQQSSGPRGASTRPPAGICADLVQVRTIVSRLSVRSA